MVSRIYGRGRGARAKRGICRNTDLLHLQHAGAVMATPVPLSRLQGKELVPQAIVDRPLGYFAERFRLDIVRGHDDFDNFEAAAIEVADGHLIIELKHYAGYPENTTTIYLPFEIRGLPQVTLWIDLIIRELKIPRGWVSWQRANDPDL